MDSLGVGLCLGDELGTEWVGHRVGVNLNFLRNCQFSKVVLPFYIFVNSVYKFLLLYIPINPSYFVFSILDILMGV